MNGSAVAVVKSSAPTAGPTSWLAVTAPAMMREFAMPRSRLSTSIGTSVPPVASANTSAVPSARSAASTTAMLTCPVTITVQSRASTTTRTPLAAMMIRRRSSRSASAPAKSPTTSQGSWSAMAAEATRSGSRVWEATSSGPAASRRPSPRLVTHDDPMSQRKPVPSRVGRTVSTIRLTSTGA